jgi:hypothetical protein
MPSNLGDGGHEAGLDAQRELRDLKNQVTAMRERLEINGDDKAARLYVERCELLATNPPAPDWPASGS